MNNINLGKNSAFPSQEAIIASGKLEPSNWREWARNPRRDMDSCGELCCGGVVCSNCLAYEVGPKYKYLDYCQLRLAKEARDAQKKAEASKYQPGYPVAIMRFMACVDGDIRHRKFILAWNGESFVEKTGETWSKCEEIPPTVTVPLSDREIFGLGDVVFKMNHDGKPFTGWKSTRKAEHYCYMKRGDYANGSDLWIPMTKEVNDENA